jgi:GTP-binding protein
MHLTSHVSLVSRVSRSLAEVPGKEGVIPLLETIISHIPPPKPIDNDGEPSAFALAVNTLSSDNHLGRIVTGKVEVGKVRVGDKIKVLSRDGVESTAVPDPKVTKLFYLQGLQRVEVEEAYAGEIISLAGGCDEASVAGTVCSTERTTPLVTIPLSPPVISMTFGPNDSPLAGRDGSKLTSSMIKERLAKEVENNVTLSLKPSVDSESIDVQGRGELQIGILVETLRREGYELTVSPPKVLSVNIDGENKEPFEEVMVDVDPELQGLVIDAMSDRKGVMVEFKTIGTRARLIFQVPSRGMMGFRHTVMNLTRGDAVVNSTFSHYDKVNPRDFGGLKKGKLVSMEAGKATGYSLMPLEERGQLFISVGDEVYEGMVVGENAKQGELEVNPTKLKKLSNMRSTGAEEKVMLTPPRKMSVEEAIAYMDEDEVLEITPKVIRLRKRILDSTNRQKYNKATKQQK